MLKIAHAVTRSQIQKSVKNSMHSRCDHGFGASNEGVTERSRGSMLK